MTITGTNFEVGGTMVTLDGQPLQNLVVVDVHTITGDTPPGTPGITADLQVTTTNGGVTTMAGAFLYIADPPVITDITPDHSQVGGGAIITITGTALGPGTAIFIASSPDPDGSLDGAGPIRAHPSTLLRAWPWSVVRP